MFEVISKAEEQYLYKLRFITQYIKPEVCLHRSLTTEKCRNNIIQYIQRLSFSLSLSLFLSLSLSFSLSLCLSTYLYPCICSRLHFFSFLHSVSTYSTSSIYFYFSPACSWRRGEGLAVQIAYSYLAMYRSCTLCMSIFRSSSCLTHLSVKVDIINIYIYCKLNQTKSQLGL